MSSTRGSTPDVDSTGEPVVLAPEAIQPEEIDMVVVSMTFDAKPTDADNAALLGVLSKYIVLTRMQDGCRNVDLCSSVTVAGRHLIVQKWDSDDVQRTHFDSDVMVEMARSCQGLLATAPTIDLWEATSAHDLR